MEYKKYLDPVLAAYCYYGHSCKKNIVNKNQCRPTIYYGDFIIQVEHYMFICDMCAARFVNETFIDSILMAKELISSGKAEMKDNMFFLLRDVDNIIEEVKCSITKP